MDLSTPHGSKLHSSNRSYLDETLPVVNPKHPRFEHASSDIADVISGNSGTFVRATSAIFEDHDTVLREVNTGEVRFAGQRRVENLFDAPEDFNDAYWTVFTNGDGTSEISADGKSITFTVTSTGRATINNTYTGVAGAASVLSVTQLINSGAISVQNIRLVSTHTTVTSSGRITVSDTFTGGTDIVRFGLGVESDETSACSVTFSFPQIQDKTGASDPTIPDGYVSKGVGLGDNLVTNGGFDTGISAWVDNSIGSGSIEWNSSGYIDLIGIDGSNRGITSQAFNTEIGKPFALNFEHKDTTLITVYVGNSVGSNVLVDYNGTTAEFITKIFTATAATTYMTIYVDSTGGTTGIDNISIKSLSHGANVDGVKYFPSENGNTVASNVVTEALGTAIDSIGVFLEPAATNKCTNYNANPTDTTNITLVGGGGSAVLSAVSDETELENAGLSALCTTGKVFKLDNSGGSGTAYAEIDGAVGNTNKHSVAVWARKTAGDCYWQLAETGIGQLEITTSNYINYVSENLTPTTAGNLCMVQADVGGIAYFILNQLEESAFSTSEIITEGSATTRNADVLSYPTTYIPTNDCVFSFDWTPSHDILAITTFIFSSYLNASNWVDLYTSATGLVFRKRISDTNSTAEKTLSYSEGVTYTIKGRLSSVNGIDIWIDGAKGTGDSNTDDAALALVIDVGNDGNNIRQQTGSINNFKIHQGNFTDEEVEAL